jgi:FkbM family methyltransferase
MPRMLTTELRSYSQWGEDRLVWEYFDRKPQGVFVEVGANDPEKGSQTLLLEQMGWEGILVEPQAPCCERLRQRRARSKVVQVACGSPAQRGIAPFHIAGLDSRSSLKKYTHDPAVMFTSVAEVQVMTLNEVLEQAGLRQVDFLSIDVEGSELEVLRGLDLQRFQPRLVMVEDYLFTLKVHRHLGAAGYKLVKRTGSNNWYVPKRAPFRFNTWRERLELFRKTRLGTPLRQLKLILRGENPPAIGNY